MKTNRYGIIGNICGVMVALLTCACPEQRSADQAPATPSLANQPTTPPGSPTRPTSQPAHEDAEAKEGRGPLAAVRGLDAEGHLQVGTEDRCPVCAMKVAEHPRFASAAVLSDGTTYYFCGTGCLLRTSLHPDHYLGAGHQPIARMIVKDYFKGEPLEADKAYWVSGSDVVGPMGPALVPLRDEQELATFKERHGFKKVFRLVELDDKLWTEITGKAALR